jgi:thiol-disulfide isomerase/thioredoxin
MLLAALMSLQVMLTSSATDGGPQIVKYDHTDRRAFLSSHLKTHMLLFLSGVRSKDEQLLVYLQSAAAVNEDKVLHVHVGLDQEIPRKFFGLEKDDLPACFLYKNAEDIKYRLEDSEINTKSLLRFTIDVFEGKVQPYLRSEKIPVDETGSVVKLVSKTFSASISDPELDWFVLFHAPDCPYTVELMPVFKALAETFTSHPELKFATLDYTANEVQWTNFRLNHSPTLYLFRHPNKGTPVSFEEPGGKEHTRDSDGITAFLTDHLTAEVRGEL